MFRFPIDEPRNPACRTPNAESQLPKITGEVSAILVRIYLLAQQWAAELTSGAPADGNNGATYVGCMRGIPSISPTCFRFKDFLPWKHMANWIPMPLCFFSPEIFITTNIASAAYSQVFRDDHREA